MAQRVNRSSSVMRAVLRILSGGVFLQFAVLLWAQGSLGQGLPDEGPLDQIHIIPRRVAAELHQEVRQVDVRFDAHAKPFKVSVDLVLVPVTITDPMERLVVGLDRNNFEVFEGRNRQEIRHFSSEDAPVSLGVILDVSGSMNNKIERAREAVVEFLKIANAQDEFFLITFADKPEELGAFTSSVEEIQSKLPFTFPKGRTSLLDAIYLSVSKMQEARNQKKALLIISDGGDNHSRYTEGEIRSIVKEADLLIYSIGIYDHSFRSTEEALGPELLGNIAELTGGRSFVVDDPKTLPVAARVVGIELRNQYVIGYRPSDSPHDGKWRKIKVKLHPPKGLPPLRVWAKRGYYSPSE